MLNSNILVCLEEVNLCVETTGQDSTLQCLNQNIFFPISKIFLITLLQIDLKNKYKMNSRNVLVFYIGINLNLFKFK